MKSHGLMQAIARVNRVFKDKRDIADIATLLQKLGFLPGSFTGKKVIR